MCFVSDQSRKTNLPPPAVTFDQPLYIKAFKIESSTSVNILVRLVGSHQSINFLGSTGCLIERSGLRSAMETVYAPRTVGHIFSEIAYSSAGRRHILSSVALLSLLFEEFRFQLNEDELHNLIEFF